jgi:hypothetical protein
MATKKKVESKEKRKITVIMEPWAYERGEMIVEFKADTFTLINDDKDCTMWAIISEDPASNVFLKQHQVYAIGFTEDIQPLIDVIKRQNRSKAIKVK